MYKPKSSFDGPAWGLKGRHSRNHDEKVPGPGTYDPSDKSSKATGPKYGIGTSEKISKDTTTRRIVPGPGQYSAK